jgi:hypothetical protein
MTEPSATSDGCTLDAARVADHLAIEDLVTAYAYAVDDRDWERWQSLFTADAHVDYTSAGGIAGNPAEVAAWLGDALAIFEFCLHTTATHEIRFTGPDTARGRVHVFNRNGAHWSGRPEIVDVGAVYHDTYLRTPAGWRFSERVEHTTYITGGTLADLIRAAAVDGGADRVPPFG